MTPKSAFIHCGESVMGRWNLPERKSVVERNGVIRPFSGVTSPQAAFLYSLKKPVSP